MGVGPTDLLLVQRGATLYKATAAEVAGQSSGVASFENYAADLVALSGTTPTLDPMAAGGFTLTMTGATTITLDPSNMGTRKLMGATIWVTGDGNTLSWSSTSTIRYVGGTAPAAPNNTEINAYNIIFIDASTVEVRDGGVNMS